MKLSAIAASVLCLAASAAAARAAVVRTIAVTSVIVEENLITIRGSNFGDTAPSFVLGGHPLDVIGSTYEEVLAELPDGIAAGSYLLRVSREPNREPFTLFEVTIGAAGPQGEKGEVGPQGPVGTARARRHRADRRPAGAPGHADEADHRPHRPARHGPGHPATHPSRRHGHDHRGRQPPPAQRERPDGSNNGLGNLIVGYNERGEAPAADRLPQRRRRPRAQLRVARRDRAWDPVPRRPSPSRSYFAGQKLMANTVTTDLNSQGKHGGPGRLDRHPRRGRADGQGLDRQHQLSGGSDAIDALSVEHSLLPQRCWPPRPRSPHRARAGGRPHQSRRHRDGARFAERLHPGPAGGSGQRPRRVSLVSTGGVPHVGGPIVVRIGNRVDQRDDQRRAPGTGSRRRARRR